MDGKIIFLPRANWESFYTELKHGPQEGPSKGPAINDPSSAQKSSKSNPDPSARMSTDALPSSIQPPSFERSSRLKICRLAPLSLNHKPYRMFMTRSGKTLHSLRKNDQSTTSSTPFIPINSLSQDSLSSIAVNCGVLESLPKEALSDRKSLEVEREKQTS
ncbi:uncharacterized protein A4U43_C01F26910 [Asparagus officinalis]|uniref:Uncharacterized protein n=1 Tax=Asparagus officinalis TaxID=4686 RepID=A0A5P1FU94_ASPOF|nr:uncharacterized protein A4U43_C01F26910 [Asparagus officinalis]